jgi:transcription factor C subunit 7
VEPGIGEFYSRAPYPQPTPAPFVVLQSLFPKDSLDASYVPTGVVPGATGETVKEIHNRVGAALDALIARADVEGLRAIVVVSHAAAVIAASRVLTEGGVPEDPFVPDFIAYSGGVSTFRRLPQQQKKECDTESGASQGLAAAQWICKASSDCSFFKDGEERGW